MHESHAILANYYNFFTDRWFEKMKHMHKNFSKLQRNNVDHES
jgi:hypothetical protein